MALPIAATPVIEGEDVKRFYLELDKSEGKSIPMDELLRGREIYNAIVIKNPWLGRQPVNV